MRMSRIHISITFFMLFIIIFVNSYVTALADNKELEAKSLNKQAYDLINREKNSDPQKALRLVNKAISLDPNKQEYYLTRADVFFRLHEWDNVIKDYTIAIDLNPNNVYPYFQRGFVYYLFIKDYKKAISDLNKTIELDPNIPAAFALRGLSYRQYRLMTKACKDIKKACDMGDCDAWKELQKNKECP